MLNEVLFYILSALILVSALVLISARRPIDAALSFIVTLVSIAALFALQGSSFLFATQIIIYAGAILALILFIIMFLNIQDKNLPDEPHKKRDITFSTLAVLPFTVVLISLINKSPLVDQALPYDLFGGIKDIGSVIFNDYLLVFELISILLLVSLIGAVSLAKEDKDVK